ncbi:hypothetical protein JW964_00295, partial [candidate division KSB1 bacterium]|nr:hypothetical protein [candidate division KSB1 bacterium]
MLFALKSFSKQSDNIKGYTDIVHFKDRFIAVGSDGRIDCISKSVEKTPIDYSCKYKLNCAFANDEILIIAGDYGTILYSFDGKDFHHAKTVTDNNINGVTIKNGLILAGADNGIILISQDGKSWSTIQTKTKGNIISLSTGNSFCMGITDAGEIIKSINGNNWEIKDYNKEYAG